MMTSYSDSGVSTRAARSPSVSKKSLPGSTMNPVKASAETGYRSARRGGDDNDEAGVLDISLWIEKGAKPDCPFCGQDRWIGWDNRVRFEQFESGGREPRLLS